MIIKKIISYLVLFIFLIPSINGEYIVFKKSKDGKVLPFDPVAENAAYKAIYTLLQDLQWPMVIAAAPKLDKTLLGQLVKAESAYAEETIIRKELQKLSAEYDLAFIPTTLYEVFFIAEIANYRSEQKINYFTQADLDYIVLHKDQLKLDDKILEIIKNPKSTDQAIQNYFREQNFIDHHIIVHCLINNALLKFFALSSAQKAQQEIDAQILDNFRYVSRLKIKRWNQHYLYNEGARKALIDLEYQARRRNMGLLYRGGTHRGLYMIGAKEIAVPIEGAFLATEGHAIPAPPTHQELEIKYKTKGESWKIRDWKMPLNSLSYGNTLFQGFWYDSFYEESGGSCPCDYFSEDNLIGYTLFVNKEQYILGKLKSILFVSSLNTIAELIALGALYHSRTRVTVLPEYMVAVDGMIHVPGIGLESTNSTFIDKAGIFARLGDPLSKAAELSDFIANNAFILTIPSNGFDITNQERIAYKSAQNDLTNMLKATKVIRKHVRIKYSELTKQPLLKQSKIIEKTPFLVTFKNGTQDPLEIAAKDKNDVSLLKETLASYQTTTIIEPLADAWPITVTSKSSNGLANNALSWTKEQLAQYLKESKVAIPPGFKGSVLTEITFVNDTFIATPFLIDPAFAESEP